MEGPLTLGHQSAPNKLSRSAIEAAKKRKAQGEDCSLVASLLRAALGRA
jgi:hypothetical protein